LDEARVLGKLWSLDRGHEAGELPVSAGAEAIGLSAVA
jgi:hypothetical protein